MCTIPSLGGNPWDSGGNELVAVSVITVLGDAVAEGELGPREKIRNAATARKARPMIETNTTGIPVLFREGFGVGSIFIAGSVFGFDSVFTATSGCIATGSGTGATATSTGSSFTGYGSPP